MGDEYYSTVVDSFPWTIRRCYYDLEKIGCSSQSLVCLASNGHFGKVAVKKLIKPFDSESCAKRSWREIVIHKHLAKSSHPHIIGLIESFTPDSGLELFNNVYIVTEYIGKDLEQALKKVGKYDETDALKIIGQVLSALAYLHSAGILHRDLKPSNIAISDNCYVKLLDFGLSRTSASEMSGYVITRPYRAPEVICNWTHYKSNVDVWSAGCILAEMLTGEILFRGDTLVKHFQNIIKFVGKPNETVLSKIISINAREYIKTLPDEPPVNMNEYFHGKHYLVIELLKEMLNFDSETRTSAVDTLNHKSFDYFKAKAYQATKNFSCPILDCQLEEQSKSIDDWKELVWNICQ
ncbi:unnamed protein product [Dimorphilus gyrociliatus]|uniref:Protein kinase domain-containing protein n=1 Tax=Dimorphilus gyrociliatus TaxID=2664684 RepID=A0A7I8W8M4_9ANNE|nr:unnamed protein product [Dimorphilus gyrociliatus]